MTARYSTDLRDAQQDALIAEVGAGALIRIFTGAQPASVATAASGTLLGTLTGGSPFAPASSGGVVTANAVTGDSAADATGTAGWFRIFQADGTTAVIDGECGTSGTEMVMPSTSVTAGEPINITAITITRGNA